MRTGRHTAWALATWHHMGGFYLIWGLLLLSVFCISNWQEGRNMGSLSFYEENIRLVELGCMAPATDAFWFIIMLKDVHTRTQTGRHYINSPFPAQDRSGPSEPEKDEKGKRWWGGLWVWFCKAETTTTEKKEGKARSSKPETVLRQWGWLSIYSYRFFIQEGSAVVLSLTLMLPLSHLLCVLWLFPAHPVPQIQGKNFEICRCECRYFIKRLN